MKGDGQRKRENSFLHQPFNLHTQVHNGARVSILIFKAFTEVREKNFETNKN